MKNSFFLIQVIMEENFMLVAFPYFVQAKDIDQFGVFGDLNFNSSYVNFSQ